MKATIENLPSFDDYEARLLSTRSSANDDDDDDDVDVYERVLFETDSRHSGKLSHAWSEVMLPPRECSRALVQYGAIWTSWVHYALDQSQLEKEHEIFWDSLDSGLLTLQDHKPSWLAIYFSVICVRVYTHPCLVSNHN